MSHWCECLYEEKAAQLVLYGRALGLSHSEAEDVLQETFMALLQQGNGLKSRSIIACAASATGPSITGAASGGRLARELESKQWVRARRRWKPPRNGRQCAAWRNCRATHARSSS